MSPPHLLSMCVKSKTYFTADRVNCSDLEHIKVKEALIKQVNFESKSEQTKISIAMHKEEKEERKANRTRKLKAKVKLKKKTKTLFPKKLDGSVSTSNAHNFNLTVKVHPMLLRQTRVLKEEKANESEMSVCESSSQGVWEVILMASVCLLKCLLASPVFKLTLKSERSPNTRP
eukprot:bmy_20262T0